MASLTGISDEAFVRRSTNSTLPSPSFLPTVMRKRNTDQFGIFEFDARAFVAVVQQSVDAGLRALR